MRILLIEDDEDLCHAMTFHLKNAGYTVDTCYDGEDALHFILQEAYDLIILDRMLPSLDGLSVLSKIRLKHIETPVIITTALSDINDRVEGLDAGADDYLAKPFATEELLARVRALARRPSHLEKQDLICYGDATLDLVSLKLTGPTHSCILSKREATLAETFFKNPRTTLPRNIILSKVWGPDAPVEDGNLDNYIHFLRRRLNTIGSCLKVTTVRGIGYHLEAPNAE